MRNRLRSGEYGRVRDLAHRPGGGASEVKGGEWRRGGLRGGRPGCRETFLNWSRDGASNREGELECQLRVTCSARTTSRSITARPRSRTSARWEKSETRPIRSDGAKAPPR